MDNKTRKYLKTLAMHIKPMVQIGKFGITDGTLKTLEELLTAHELVKVRLLQNSSLSRKDVARKLAETTNAEIIQEIGRQVVFFRRNHKKPKIQW